VQAGASCSAGFSSRSSAFSSHSSFSICSSVIASGARVRREAAFVEPVRGVAAIREARTLHPAVSWLLGKGLALRAIAQPFPLGARRAVQLALCEDFFDGVRRYRPRSTTATLAGQASRHRTCIKDRKFPAGSLNHAIVGPRESRAIPFASVFKSPWS
jgi:hypothetical protein